MTKDLKNLSPKKTAFLNYFTDPDSETFGNAKASAIRAGYSESYANRITCEDWVTNNFRIYSIVHTAENNLLWLLENGTEKVKADLTKFALERLKKSHYSTRQELSGPQGQPIFLPSDLIEKNDLDKEIVEAEVVGEEEEENQKQLESSVITSYNTE